MKQWDFTGESADWTKANWANGDPFNVGWRPGHIGFAGNQLQIQLDNQPFSQGGQNLPYTSGEYRTTQFYKYGLYEVSMKPVKASGTVSSFFIYTGPSDGNPHDEIDIEFLGQNTTQVQFNYHTNGVGAGVHEYFHDLGFDAANSFHTYGFRWSPTSIQWFVDGVLIHQATSNLPSHAGKIMMNLWTGTAATTFWMGPFAYNNPLKAQYDWARFTPLNSGGFS